MTKCPKCGQEVQVQEAECPKCGTDLGYIKEKIAQQEAQASEERAKRKQTVGRLSELVSQMSMEQLEGLIVSAEELLGKKKRVHDRVPCLITADCVCQGKAANTFVKDISMGGVFIESVDALTEGAEVTLTLSFAHHSKPFRISGDVVRSSPRGFGVQFKPLGQVQKELVQNLVEQVAKFKK